MLRHHPHRALVGPVLALAATLTAVTGCTYGRWPWHHGWAAGPACRPAPRPRGEVPIRAATAHAVPGPSVTEGVATIATARPPESGPAAGTATRPARGTAAGL